MASRCRYHVVSARNNQKKTKHFQKPRFRPERNQLERASAKIR